MEKGYSYVVCTVGFIGFLGLTTACDRGVQDVTIATQDFRFAPREIHLAADRPVRMVIRNEGRERHEVISPLLTQATVRLPDRNEPSPGSDLHGISILPGQSLELRFTPKSGLYELRCLVKGHAGMRGIIIAES